MKPGELERNLSRLVQATRAARERLAAMERELAELRHEMERLAAQPAAETGPAAGPTEAQGVNRRDRGEAAARPTGDHPGREAGSE